MLKNRDITNTIGTLTQGITQLRWADFSSRTNSLIQATNITYKYISVVSIFFPHAQSGLRRRMVAQGYI